MPRPPTMRRAVHRTVAVVLLLSLLLAPVQAIAAPRALQDHETARIRAAVQHLRTTGDDDWADDVQDWLDNGRILADPDQRSRATTNSRGAITVRADLLAAPAEAASELDTWRLAADLARMLVHEKVHAHYQAPDGPEFESNHRQPSDWGDSAVAYRACTGPEATEVEAYYTFIKLLLEWLQGLQAETAPQGLAGADLEAWQTRQRSKIDFVKGLINTWATVLKNHNYEKGNYLADAFDRIENGEGTEHEKKQAKLDEVNRRLAGIFGSGGIYERARQGAEEARSPVPQETAEVQGCPVEGAQLTLPSTPGLTVTVPPDTLTEACSIRLSLLNRYPEAPPGYSFVTPGGASDPVFRIDIVGDGQFTGPITIAADWSKLETEARVDLQEGAGLFVYGFEKPSSWQRVEEQASDDDNVSRWTSQAARGIYAFLVPAEDTDGDVSLADQNPGLASHWAYSALDDLYQRDALEGSGPSYDPNAPADRGLVMQYLTLGWGVQAYTGHRQFFTDVDSSNPYAPYVSALYLRGLMRGIGSGQFGLDSAFTREQAATVLVRASDLEAAALARPLAEAQAVVAEYVDGDLVSSWAVPYVAQAKISGLMVGGTDGRFRPQASLSRAETATITVRIRDQKPLADFGDAPDWPGIFGFPSLLTSNGVHHRDYRTVWLGERADGEKDSRQINADFFDDGFVRFLPDDTSRYPSAACRVEFEVSVRDRNPLLYSDSDAEALFFNLLVDFDKDMTWESDEWVVRNMRINPNHWPGAGNTATLVSPAFKAPGDPYQCWFRMTLTRGQPVPNNWTGTGAFDYGETEDYGPEEQKLVVLKGLEDLTADWKGSGDDNKYDTALLLADIIPLVVDLIAEEQADDPVVILLEKKKVILERLHQAATFGHALGLSQDDVDRIWERLWKLMAFVTEEEAKRHTVDILQNTLARNLGISGVLSQRIRAILAQIADLMMEQERGDPPHILLAKKDNIIKGLQELVAGLEAQGLLSAAKETESALSWMLFIKALEEPIPPGQPPTEPPPDEPGEEEPPPSEPEEAPELPGQVTGVSSVFEVSDGVIRMKIHLLTPYWNDGPPVHDIEIYYAHQDGWPEGTTVESVSVTGLEGWESQVTSAGIRLVGGTPIPLCTPVYLEIMVDGEFDLDYLKVVLTDENHNPIGYTGSQRVGSGVIQIPVGHGANLEEEAEGAEQGPDGSDGGYHVDSFFDIYYSIDTDSMPVLTVDPELMGGIVWLKNGEGDLEYGDYAPETGYNPSAGPVEVGQVYALRDHIGEGYALLRVAALDEAGITLEFIYNPKGRLLMP